ncbi:hypothetical protein [Winogradskyella flava]|uniref:Uncharacterized protein n=1 Tax=Winogradskyella flava TaxID=1884876 RepID=A0A842IQ91_9FLAO|nr:hypothetical protein [Winogradskyella flava]MBC2845170.1 hypothetical protein [Winogradskyella flava]
MKEIENTNENIKLYSSKAIGGATFLGGPLAAGYMISENFKALDKPDDGRKSLIIGIATTIVLFGGMVMLPERIIDKIPRQLIPLIYTGIIWGIVEWTQGDVLKAHKENGNSFFSGWKAAAIGLISLIIIGIGIFGYVYIESNNPAYKIYDTKIAEFSKNESESLTFYDNINFKSNSTLLSELDNKVIPKWERNIQLINELENIDGLPSDLLDQNKTLLTYSELRLEAFLLIKKAISEDTGKYDTQLNMLNIKIENELNKLN